jgi:hypothetical protein
MTQPDILTGRLYSLMVQWLICIGHPADVADSIARRFLRENQL